LIKKARKITAAQYNGKSDTFNFHAEPGRVRHDLFVERARNTDSPKQAGGGLQRWQRGNVKDTPVQSTGRALKASQPMRAAR